MAAPIETVMALDVGDARIGVALARSDVRIASPLTTVAGGEAAVAAIAGLASEHSVSRVVIGLPRNLRGDDTEQTAKVRAFAKVVEASCSLPVAFQDEALTSVKAEGELKRRGKPFAREAVDALAATYILEDYLNVSGGQAVLAPLPGEPYVP